MNCPRRLPVVWSLDGNPSTGSGHRRQDSGEGHPVGLPQLSTDIHLLVLSQNPPVDTRYILSKGGLWHYISTLVATYPCPLPLPKGGPPPLQPPLVLLLPHFTPDKTRRACYGLGILQIIFQPQPLKHTYECRQCPLNRDEVSTCNTAIIGVEHYVCLPSTHTIPC